MRYEICAVTDVGCLRGKNEDGFYASESYAYGRSYMSAHEIAEPPFIAFVMDGVGGSEFGEKAVRTGIDFMCRGSLPLSQNELGDAICQMNSEIYELTKTMDTASTIAGLLFSGEKIAFNIGDSKVYAINNGYMEQISIDDTLSGLSGGELSEQKEPLIQYLGKSSVVPHFRLLETGNLWLICSDGLSDMISIDRIEEILSFPMNMQGICDRLVEEAKQNGGYDNITVILIKECEEDE